jgi:HK97 family phage prohead protease
MAEETRIDDGSEVERPRAPVERRSAEVADLNVGQRIATVIVAPYDQSTPVMWRDEVWTESFERGAWDGIERRPNRVRANRAHDRRMTCGKAIKFFPNHERGLVAEVRMAQTQLGEETLQLLKDDCLSVSAGFAALPADQLIDRRNKTRRIKVAYLDHISFVEDPAYPGAEVLDVRENALILPEEFEEPPAPAPALEERMNLPGLQWASEYLKTR